MIPGGFPSLRPFQESMADIIQDACKRYSPAIQCHAAPTGIGKTLGYITGCWRGGLRTAVLTHTKSLQDQILRDFSREVKDLRGAANFRCPRWGSCERGRARKCQHASCPYLEQFEAAAKSSMVVANYAMWISAVLSNAPIGRFSAIVCDEAHLLDAVLTDCCGIELTTEEAKQLGIPAPSLMLSEDLLNLGERLAMLKPANEDDDARLDWNRRVWSRMSSVVGQTIVCKRDGNHVSLHTLWPHGWFRSLIKQQARVVILCSATLCETQVAMSLGLDRTEFEFYDYPSPFDPAKSPIYLYPRGALRHNSSRETVDRVFSAACEISRLRPSSRGIIHTVSYDRAEQLIRFAEQREPQVAMRMTQSTYEYMNRPDAVLVSPSVGTGHDFSDDACRWQVVLKAPYPNLADPVVNARRMERRDYMQHVMAANLIQICGRNVRHENDYGETFVLDGIACDYLSSSSAPEWVRARVRRIFAVPEEQIKTEGERSS